MTAAEELVALSRWVDASIADQDSAAVTWGRVSKIGEEFGEVIQAMIGWTNQNPRKGQTHERRDVMAELLDVAVAALAAYEHLDDHQGLALHSLDLKIAMVARRAGLVS